MGIVIVVVCLGAGLNLALWGALYRTLCALPQNVRRLAQAERAGSDERALTALQEAAASKVGTLILGLRQYHEAFEAHLRAEVAQAETRARVAERRSTDAATVLGAASTLLSELRGLVEDLPQLLARAAVQHAVEGTPTLPPEPSGAHEPAEARGATVEIRRDERAVDTARRPDAPEPVSRERPATGVPVAAVLEDDEPEEEKTHVAKHPLPGVRSETRGAS